MIQLNPYLSFGGACREAMNFYKNCLGGELTVLTVADSLVAAQCPAGMQHHIMHSELKHNDFTLMGSDMNREGYNPGNDMAISLLFDSEEVLNDCFIKLSDGGTVLDPLSVKFWGSSFGIVKDKFGKVWMLNGPQN